MSSPLTSPSPRRAPSIESSTGTPPVAPWTLRDYALLADGERGALLGPRGELVWMCAPRWHSDGVFSALLGGPGEFTVGPRDPWHVWGGYYEEGSLIRVSRWVLTDAVTECREALALPADGRRAVLLRRIRAVRGEACVHLRLSARAGFGAHPMSDHRRDEDGQWHARSGPLQVRLHGAEDASPDSEGTLTGRITLPEGGRHDVVLELSETADSGPLDPDRLWEDTERSWARAVPDCAHLAAPADARQAYAVLHGLTSRSGGMVAAATTSLPERADAGRDYDYRYVWIRDQCFSGLAVAEHGPHPLLDDAVRFVAERILDDGPTLRPAYAVDGSPVPPERRLALPGYPGGSDRAGNQAGRQFQLDVFGEALQLLAAAAQLGRLDELGRRAAHTAVRAIEENWQRPEAGMWELEPAWWTHSRLSAVVGLRAAAEQPDVRGREGRHWERLADTVYRETERRCRHASGRWQRAPDDPGVDAALLRPLTRGPWPEGDAPGLTATREAVRRHLGQDGYVYRFRHGDHPLGQDEGAFLLCGFLMSAASLVDGRPIEAARWFERTRGAAGSPGLFSEEYDVSQRQLRGNLPQAFVHGLLLETAVRLASTGDAPTADAPTADARRTGEYPRLHRPAPEPRGAV